jgi:SAM-dependent methyltransferase
MCSPRLCMSMIGKLTVLKRRPSVLKDIVEEMVYRRKYKDEVNSFISSSKSSYYSKGTSKTINLNKLCCIEDWENEEMKALLKELGKISWSGGIHRKDWEWALGIIAMSRYRKINKESVALGVGSGKEAVMYYLANNIQHVFATDLYEGNSWEEAPADFPENPKKYCRIPYSENSLTVIKMDGRKLDFPSDKFDIVFSFSSIEHFGGYRHQGALMSLKEIERVLKPDGIAVIATEFIINDKEDTEFFNKRTIYSDLIDNLDQLKLVESLDLTISNRTLDTLMDYYPTGIGWDKRGADFKYSHPHILLRRKNMLWTSIMLVFKKLTKYYVDTK